MSEFKKYYEKSKVVSARPYVPGEEEEGDSHYCIVWSDFSNNDELGMIVLIIDWLNKTQQYRYMPMDKFNEKYSLCDHADYSSLYK